MATLADKEAKKITQKQAEHLWTKIKGYDELRQALFDDYGIQNKKGNIPGYNLARDIMQKRLRKDLQIRNTKKSPAKTKHPSYNKDELNQIEIIIALGKNGKSAQEIIDMGYGI